MERKRRFMRGGGMKAARDKIAYLREEIDDLDRHLLSLLKKRM